VTATVLDTNVISELIRKKPEASVIAFLEGCDEPLVSVVTFHELAFGIARLRDTMARTRLELFLQGIKDRYAARIVTVDVSIAELGGRLRAVATRAGWGLSQMDSLVAATAIALGARIATRNVRDFVRLEIPIVNPWPA
jgi:toxin FitB